MGIEQYSYRSITTIDEVKMKIYHGSKRVVDHVKYHCGKPNNDYGIGFYCCTDSSLAKEWAVAKNRDGYINT